MQKWMGDILRKAALLDILGVSITLGGLLLILLYIVQTLLTAYTGMQLYAKLKVLKALSSQLALLG